MYKQQTENKAQRSAIMDTFTGTLHGKTIHRRDLEDPMNPGHLKEGLLLEPDAWSAAQFWGLRTPSGRSIGFIEPQPDPREPSVADAPAKLREELAAAQREADTITAERQKVIDALARAEDGVREVTELANTRRIGEAEARQKFSEFEAARIAAEARLRELDEFRLPPVRVRLSEAQKRLRWWLDDERLRRLGRA